jgi:hypothetical protein
MTLYNGNKLIIVPRKNKFSINRWKNKIIKFPIVMPLCAEKRQYTYIHTWKLIVITITQFFLLICVLTQHPNNNNNNNLIRCGFKCIFNLPFIYHIINQWLSCKCFIRFNVNLCSLESIFIGLIEGQTLLARPVFLLFPVPWLDGLCFNWYLKLLNWG